jgi:hypothetical protein
MLTSVKGLDVAARQLEAPVHEQDALLPSSDRSERVPYCRWYLHDHHWYLVRRRRYQALVPDGSNFKVSLSSTRAP